MAKASAAFCRINLLCLKTECGNPKHTLLYKWWLAKHYHCFIYSRTPCKLTLVQSCHHGPQSSRDEICRGYINVSHPTCSSPNNLMYMSFTLETASTKTPIVQLVNPCTLTSVTNVPAYGINNDSRILIHASYAFDVSLSNMFLRLFGGACYDPRLLSETEMI